MVKRVVPALFGAVLVAAVMWIAVQHWGAGTPPGAGGAGDAAVPPISGTVRNFTPTIPRRPAPIEPFYDADGHELSLQGFGGKVVLLNLWATWCAPCLKEMPSLDRLQAQLGSDRFQVIAVSVDRRGVEAVRPFFEKLKISHLAIYVEPKNRAGRVDRPADPALDHHHRPAWPDGRQADRRRRMGHAGGARPGAALHRAGRHGYAKIDHGLGRCRPRRQTAA